MAGPPERGYQRYSLDLRIAYAGDCAGKRSNQARSPAPAGLRRQLVGLSVVNRPFATSRKLRYSAGGASATTTGAGSGGAAPLRLVPPACVARPPPVLGPLTESTKSAMRGAISARKREPLKTP